MGFKVVPIHLYPLGSSEFVRGTMPGPQKLQKQLLSMLLQAKAGWLQLTYGICWYFQYNQ